VRRPFSQERDEVKRCDDADEPSLVDHWQRSDDMSGHQRGRFADGLVRTDRDDWVRHRLTHRRIRADIHQIAVGDEANDVLSIDHDEVVDVIAAEHLFCG